MSTVLQVLSWIALAAGAVAVVAVLFGRPR